MKNKIISVIGPTAVGKTQFVLDIVGAYCNTPLQGGGDTLFGGCDIISADSRQVYKNIKIISGTDIPDDLPANIKIHGVNILAAEQDWSVAHFVKFARKIILDAFKKDRLVIIVGGTGLYHQQLFNPAETLNIKPDFKLRADLEALSVKQLQNKLKNINIKKYKNLNNSDQNNPRRLIRAIEIAHHVGTGYQPVRGHNIAPGFTIGLTDNLNNINQKIKQRVSDRFDQGLLEIKKLKKIKNINQQLLSATGVAELLAYLDKKITKQQCLDQWALREYQYAKRQLTFFQKIKNINWFKVSQAAWQQKAISEIKNYLYT